MNMVTLWRRGTAPLKCGWKAFMAAVLVLFMWNATVLATPAHGQHPLYLSFEKRLILTYILAGTGEPEEAQLKLAERLEKVLIQYINTPIQDVEVKNFKEFLRAYQGPWPSSYSVASDIHLIEAGQMRGPLNYKAVNSRGEPNERLQNQIKGFMASQNQQLIKKSMLEAAPMLLLNPITEVLLRDVSGLKKKDWILEGFRQATQLFNRQMKQLEKIGDQVAASGKLSNLEPDIKLFLETVLQEYFSRLGMDSKKQLVSNFLGQNLMADSMTKFEMMLMGAGPQFQKLLQVIAGNSSVSKDLQHILKKLESRILPIPPAIVQKLFEAERDRYQWVSYKLDPLGTGTMAQVHRGVIRTPRGDQNVVIRFLKPEIETRVREDERILLEIAQLMDADQRFRQAGLPKLGPVIQDLNKTVTDELDLSATVQRQKLGRESYNRTVFLKTDGYKNYLRIHVPEVIEAGSGSKLMVQELVQGQKLDAELETYREVIPKLGRVLSENLATVWAHQAFFGSGFFHSDLHQGNYLVNVMDSEIVLSPLDFGMGGVLTKQMQAQVILLGIGIQLQRLDLISKALWDLSVHQINKTTQPELEVQIRQRLEQLRRSGVSENLNQWMNWALDAGVRFPYEMVSLNRGMVILDQALKEVGSTETISSIAEKLVPRYGKSLIWSLNTKGILTNRDFLKLGLSLVEQSQGKISTSVSTPKAVPATVRQCSQIHRMTSGGR